MDKNLIVTITIGDRYTQLSKATHPTIEKYAEKIGCDFIVIRDTKYSIPHYEKCNLKKLFEEYDRICYIDTDIIVHPDAPNIFDIVPENKLGLFNELPYHANLEKSFIKYLNDKNIQIPKELKYYNTGVIVASKNHSSFFEDPKVIEEHFFEQTYLNSNIIKNDIEVFSLPFRYNRQYCLNEKIPEHYLYSYFVHYSSIFDHQDIEKTIKDVNNDLDAWKLGYFSNKKCIHVLNIGNYYPELTEITLPLIEKYSRRIGADLNIITDRKYNDYPVTYEKMQVHDYGKNYNWNILMDLDLLVNPNAPDITINPKDKVYTQYIFNASNYFQADRFFIRDGRDVALCAFFVMTTDLTHDLWKPLKGSYQENQHKTKREHIIDEYCISNNMAKYGLKYSGIGHENHFKHIGMTTDMPNQHQEVMKQVKQFLETIET
jgi:hypothetical protein